jgi:hypothetical protein
MAGALVAAPPPPFQAPPLAAPTPPAGRRPRSSPERIRPALARLRPRPTPPVATAADPPRASPSPLVVAGADPPRANPSPAVPGASVAAAVARAGRSLSGRFLQTRRRARRRKAADWMRGRGAGIGGREEEIRPPPTCALLRTGLTRGWSRGEI